jgi:proteasome lid subunit RPN8/RPN11
VTLQAQPFLIRDLPDEVREGIYDHVFASDEAEVGGVLVGCVSATGKAEVHAMIPARSAEGARASITFTTEAWDDMHAIRDRDHPDSPTFVGWYHSHPGFGIFLSDADVFIHRNWFGHPFQIAFVVDPQDEEEGVFGWRGDEVVLYEEGRTPRRRGRRRPTIVVELSDLEPDPEPDPAALEPARDSAEAIHAGAMDAHAVVEPVNSAPEPGAQEPATTPTQTSVPRSGGPRSRIVVSEPQILLHLNVRALILILLLVIGVGAAVLLSVGSSETDMSSAGAGSANDLPVPRNARAAIRQQRSLVGAQAAAFTKAENKDLARKKLLRDMQTHPCKYHPARTECRPKPPPVVAPPPPRPDPKPDPPPKPTPGGV